MVFTWLTALSWISFAVVLVCAGVLRHDIFVRSHRMTVDSSSIDRVKNKVIASSSRHLNF